MTKLLLKTDDLAYNISLPNASLKPILDSISFTLDNGESIGVLGSSGAGKSSLAKLLKGIQSQSSGRIFFKGEEITARQLLSNPKVQLVYQFPDESLTPRRSILSILLEYLTQYKKLSKIESIEVIQSYCESFRVNFAHLDHSVDQLSGGEKQRIALMRALLVEPELLICDEVFSALDEPLQQEIMGILLDLQKDQGFALIMITHDLGLLKSHFNKVLLLDQGQQEHFGSLSSLLKQNHPFIEKSVEALKWLGA